VLSKPGDSPWSSLTIRWVYKKGLRTAVMLGRDATIRTATEVSPIKWQNPDLAATVKRALRSQSERVRVLRHELTELLRDLDGFTQAVCPGMDLTKPVPK
jgi:hypothetical protein